MKCAHPPCMATGSSHRERVLYCGPHAILDCWLIFGPGETDADFDERARLYSEIVDQPSNALAHLLEESPWRERIAALVESLR